MAVQSQGCLQASAGRDNARGRGALDGDVLRVSSLAIALRWAFFCRKIFKLILVIKVRDRKAGDRL
jgi:hypothetical protein